MEFNLYVYYIVVVSVIVFYCVWQYKRYEFVKKNSKCYKETKAVVKNHPSECDKCPYNKGDGYCFPCMKKILGK